MDVGHKMDTSIYRQSWIDGPRAASGYIIQFFRENSSKYKITKIFPLGKKERNLSNLYRPRGRLHWMNRQTEVLMSKHRGGDL